MPIAAWRKPREPANVLFMGLGRSARPDQGEGFFPFPEGFIAQLTSLPTDLYSFPFYAPGLNCSSGVRRKTRVSLA